MRVVSDSGDVKLRTAAVTRDAWRHLGGGIRDNVSQRNWTTLKSLLLFLCLSVRPTANKNTGETDEDFSVFTSLGFLCRFSLASLFPCPLFSFHFVLYNVFYRPRSRERVCPFFLPFFFSFPFSSSFLSISLHFSSFFFSFFVLCYFLFFFFFSFWLSFLFIYNFLFDFWIVFL